MSSTISVPDPCLTAILLVCQTRSGSGPQLIFHWPPDPLAQQATNTKYHSDSGSPGNGIASNDSDESSSDEETLPGFATQDEHDNVGAFHETDWTAGDSNPHEQAQSKTRILLGLDEDGLVSLLAPDRTWNKRKFELSINDLTFVGRPIFAKQNGSWRKRQTPRTNKHRSVSPEARPSSEDDTAGSTSDGEAKDLKTIEPSTKSELVMFHVVFVMSPPPLDHVHKVKEMYDSVVKKFSKALKWVQVRHDYVQLEAESILGQQKRTTRTLETLSDIKAADFSVVSPLARSIVTVFRAISASKIASVTLLPGVSISLQIPPVTSTAYLPSLAEPSLPPGLWLTTATEATPGDEAANKHSVSSSTLQLAKSYTLLLKSPPQRIAKDAQLAGGPLASHLPKFVAALRPTKSFWKLSNSAQISLTDVQLLARHLIYWRRAIAIPPLHQWDTYIVSPNADFRKLREACRTYEAQFPAPLPSLPKLLSDLSGLPRPFGSLIPSQDHKEDYLLALAWLLRNGWVTQLRTFAYIRVTSDIKQQARERERESRASVSQSFNSNSEPGGYKSYSNEHPSRPSFVSRQSSEGQSSMKGNRVSDRVTSLIKSPSRASPEESRWLKFLHEGMLNEPDLFSQLSEDERHELYHYWPTLIKYFDGSVALECIPVREDLKRKLVWSLYSRLGLRFDGRVEDPEGGDQRILLTVRHW